MDLREQQEAEQDSAGGALLTTAMSTPVSAVHLASNSPALQSGHHTATTSIPENCLSPITEHDNITTSEASHRPNPRSERVFSSFSSAPSITRAATDIANLMIDSPPPPHHPLLKGSLIPPTASAASYGGALPPAARVQPSKGVDTSEASNLRPDIFQNSDSAFLKPTDIDTLDCKGGFKRAYADDFNPR
jgi:hypothetical protein